MAQTYENIEIIVVDDNGLETHNQLATEKIIGDYIKNPKFKYICHKENSNGSTARNTGVKNSDGEYIALLDDDDVFLPDKVMRQVALLEDSDQKVGAVYCSHRTYLGRQEMRPEKAQMSGSILYEYMSHQVEIASSAIMIRRSVWNELGGFDESFKRHQDWEFISRLLSKYEIIGDDFYGFERHLIFRNSRVSPEVVKQRRLYYLKKMEPVLSMLSNSKRNNIIYNEFVDIAITYIKAHQIRGFIREIMPLVFKPIAMKILFKKTAMFIKRGGKYIH